MPEPTPAPAPAPPAFDPQPAQVPVATAPEPEPESEPLPASAGAARELFQGFTVIVADDPDAWASNVAPRVNARVIASAFTAEQVLAHRAEMAEHQRRRDRLEEAERLAAEPGGGGDRLNEVLAGRTLGQLRSEVAVLGPVRPGDNRPILLADPTRGLPANRKRALLAEFERLSKLAPVVLVTADPEVQAWAASR
jgi:hypothetical protein